MHTIPLTSSGLALLATLALTLAGCGESEKSTAKKSGTGTHTHADGTVHPTHEGGEKMHKDDHDHDHEHDDEVALDPITIDGMTIVLAQSHGAVAAAKEGHLVVKLPYSDNGATIVRAWIGTEDRTLSFVGRGEYAASHDDYDIHAMAPDPLPENAMWWVEIEKPDGTKVVGSTKPKID